MATWNTIQNTEIAVDAPVTSQLMTKVRDNLDAVTEGASGAPKIQTAAYQANSVDQAAIESAIKAKYLIESVNINATTHTFATVSGYDRYKIEYEFTGGGSTTGMRVGNTTPSSSFVYEFSGTYTRASSSNVEVLRDTSNDFMYIVSQSAEAVGSIEIMGANQTGSYCYAKSSCSILIGGELYDYSVGSIYRVKNNTNAFQIGNYGFGSTAITGTVRLYGYRT